MFRKNKTESRFYKKVDVWFDDNSEIVRVSLFLGEHNPYRPYREFEFSRPEEDETGTWSLHKIIDFNPKNENKWKDIIKRINLKLKKELKNKEHGDDFVLDPTYTKEVVSRTETKEFYKRKVVYTYVDYPKTKKGKEVVNVYPTIDVKLLKDILDIYYIDIDDPYFF